MKEKVLTNTELGEYAANHTRTCSADMVTNHAYGCTIVGELMSTLYDGMSYYWSDTCHWENYYGYTSTDTSGCSGHNDYEGSKVKEYLEGTYINTLGADNLKEVDGYKIRLIKLEELQSDLGVSTEMSGSWYDYDAENTPSWVYQKFSDSNNNAKGYWTMTSRSDTSFNVWNVHYGFFVNSFHLLSYDIGGVRPVINLLKSNI